MKGLSTQGKRLSTQAIRRMVVVAMLSAITVLMTFTTIGMITLPAPLPSVTLVHIPVILAALVEGPVAGLLVGLVFGVCSLISAWESGVVGLNLFFRDPLVSVLPRLLIPLTAWGVYALWNKLIKKKGAADKAGAAVASAVGALTNTVFCLGMIVVLYSGSKSIGFLDINLTDMINNLVSAGSAEAGYLNNAGGWLIAIVGLPYGLAEAAAAAVLVPLIKIAVDAATRRSKRGTPKGIDVEDHSKSGNTDELAALELVNDLASQVPEAEQTAEAAPGANQNT
jgi:uncharacterized membrane protein